MTRYLRILLTVAALPASGCLLTDYAEIVEHRNLDFAGITQVRFESRSGAVDVDGDEGETDIDIHITKFARGRTDEEAEKNAASISVEVKREPPDSPVLVVVVDVPRELRHRSAGAHLDVSIPPRVDLEIHTSNGRVDVKETEGTIDIDTGNGKVDLSSITGDIVAKSGNGSMVIEDVVGNAELRSSNGRITLERVEAERIVASTSNGSIKAREVSGSTSFDTSNGSIELIFTSLPDSPELKAETNNGSIYMEVPATVNARLVLHTSNGRIFERLGSAKVTDYEHSRRHIEATLNGGGGTIDARTSNGAITFRTN